MTQRACPASGLGYRPDIDGLRALAVLAILGFHAFPRHFPGGFVGVDVFFVISGYLISLVIRKDLCREKFSLGDFYARRIRRIFPALLAVLITTLVLGWLSLLGPEFRALGQRAAGGAAFVTNFLLLDTRGYFATRSDSEPLLHLWSLAIEEQFYIVWPLLVWAAWRRNLSLSAMAGFLTAASFAFNLWVIRVNGEAFFLPTTRAWELGVGALLAFAPGLVRPAKSFLRESMAAVGLFAIILAILKFDRKLAYPSALSLIPVLGTALIIAAGIDSYTNRRVLSIPLLVGCGLISYPLYLWHWPLLSLGHIIAPEMSRVARALLLAASFLLAFLTYMAVERPVRFGQRGAAKLFVLMGSMALTGCAGLSIYRGDVPSASQFRGIDQNSTDKLFAASTDWEFPGKAAEDIDMGDFQFVRYPGRKDRNEVWFLGDSQMEQYSPRIEKMIAAHPRELPSAVFTTKGGCPPLPNFTWAKFKPLCKGFLDRAMEYARGARISTVVIGAAWFYLLDGFTYSYIDGASESQVREAVYQKLEDLLGDLHSQGKTVYLLLPIPVGNALDPALMITRRLTLKPFRFLFAIPDHPGLKDQSPAPEIRARLSAIAARTSTQVIDPYPYLCRQGFCPAFDDAGEPIYKDEDHLRATFVREHAEFIDRVLSEN